MNNNIDLSNFSVRTDLAIESIDRCQNKPKISNKKDGNININIVNITKNMMKESGKREGIYITIEFKDVTNYEDREKLGKVLQREIEKMLITKKIEAHDEGIVIGLGNEKCTPDALGPKVINSVVVTRHLFLLKTNVKEGIRSIAAISPGVTGTTGIETADYIKSIIATIKPKFVIVIDALAASSIERVNKTIQLTDSGIQPGSGVGNDRKEISSDTIGIPVIALGVPTVVGISTIVNETIIYLFKHISYIKNNTAINKLTYNHFGGYLQKLKKLDAKANDKETILGLVGGLSDKEINSLIIEVLEAINYNLIVTPKEIDFIIEKLSEVIANSLNNALHRQITHF